MSMNKYLVPMSSPEINEADRQAVLDVLNTNSLSMGPKIEAFEHAVKFYTGSQHAIGVNSGTSGLHLCVRAAGIQEGDYVITTPFSFVASANVILFEKAIPIFVDVDASTGNIDTKAAAQAAADLTSADAARKRRWLPRSTDGDGGKLRAILAVDVFGQPADYAALREIADQYDLILIEDSCEALGATYRHQKAGTLGDYGVFAFYPNKQITTAEGGMIVTSNRAAADLMRALRNQGRAPGDTWLQHTYLGYNYRLDEMSAALGLAQMARIDSLLDKRQAVAEIYNQSLCHMPGIEIPFISPLTTRMSWFVYVIRLKAGIDREKTAQKLEEEGIPVRPYFLPIHLQPYMVDQFGYQSGDFPVTEDLGRRSLALPFSASMESQHVKLVCDKFAQCLNT